ncbi:MAG: thermonuclease family protein [Actinobacteria bacterium]|nr:thermonuclease family protein [Actinomycetota bacterium]
MGDVFGLGGLIAAKKAAALAHWAVLPFKGKTLVAVGAAVAIPMSATQGVIALSSASGGPETGTVVRVVDGDTVRITVAGQERKVRLLNIDAPETVHPSQPVACLGPQAADALSQLLPVGSKVHLEYDLRRTDRYGRDLAVVNRPGQELVNVTMVATGLAVPYDDRDNRTFYPRILAAAESATARGVGLYGTEASCTMASEVAALEQQAEGLREQAKAVADVDIDTVDRKAAGLTAAAAALLTKLASTSGFEYAGLPARVVEGHRDSVGSVTLLAQRARASMSTQRESIAAAAKAAAEAQAKAEAEAAAAAQRAADEAAAAAQAAAAADAAQRAAQSAPQPFVGGSSGGGGAVHYANCAAARAAGAAPLRIGEPGYRPGLDRDKDGIACE